MNAQLTKEIRSVQTLAIVGFIGAPLLSLVIRSHDALGIVFFAFIGVCALLGASAFGQEFEARTISVLLSQPTPRRQIWFEKMRILAGALVICYVSTFVSLMLGHHPTLVERGTVDIALLMLLGVAIIFCSAPYYSLVTRSFNASVAFTFLIPFGLAGGFFFLCFAGARFTSTVDAPLLENQFQNHPYWSIGLPAVIYCTLLYWLGYRAFNKLQVMDTHSTELKLPTAVEAKIGSVVTKFIPGYTGPIASLIRKELYVQRMNYLIALVICVLFVVEGIAWMLHPWGGLDVLMMAEWFIYSLGIPVLAGIVCFAEERNWGTSPWQITLPISPLKQWLVKISVAVFTVAVLGIFLPSLGAEAANAGAGPFFRDVGHFSIFQWTLDGGCQFLLAYFIVFGVVLLASSLCLNSLQSLVFAGVLLVACGVAFGFGNDFAEFLGASDALSLNTHPALLSLVNMFSGLFNVGTDVGLGLIPRVFVIVFPPLLLAGLLLMIFKNFRNGDLNPRRKWLQAIAVFCCVVLPALALDILGRIHP